MYYTEECKITEFPIPVYVQKSGTAKGYNSISLPPIVIERNRKKQTGTNDYKQITEKWADAFNQLSEAQDTSNYNMDVVMPSANTVTLISKWLNEAFTVDLDLASPDIVPDGEGGLDIEWNLTDKLVSIHIDNSDETLNRIFVKNPEGYKSIPLTEANIKIALTS